MTGTTTIVQLEARRDMQGRLLALQTVLLGGSAAIGGPLLGWIADKAGARVLMELGGVACLAAAAFGLVMSRRFHDDGARSDELTVRVGTPVSSPESAEVELRDPRDSI
jgi:MFS family permease